uniref:Uncharacterized protein n=1 Tax=Ascaris lumbricoides TaxID=6252 RepID=A0A0M3HLR6_ASCLU
MGNKIYPIVYASPTGTIFVTVNMGVIIEVSLTNIPPNLCKYLPEVILF